MPNFSTPGRRQKTLKVNIPYRASRGLRVFETRDAALAAMEQAVVAQASAEAGAAEVRLVVTRDVREAEVQGQVMFIEAVVTAVASGRPRVARQGGVEAKPSELQGMAD